MRSRARHLARLGLRRHRHQDTDKHIDRRHRWAVIGGPEQDNTQYSPLIGPSETRQPGTSPSSGEKMTAWRRVWSSLRGPRTGDTRWWPRLSPTKTYRWVSRPNRGITFWRHSHIWDNSETPLNFHPRLYVQCRTCYLAVGKLWLLTSPLLTCFYMDVYHEMFHCCSSLHCSNTDGGWGAACGCAGLRAFIGTYD